MDIRITECCGPNADHLEQFKQYASVPDDSRDGVLLKMLKRAMLAVQEYSDIAVLPCTIQLTAQDIRKGEAVRLYQGGTTVTSVVDQDANEVPYTLEGNRVIIGANCKALVVTYTNSVNVAQAEALQPVIWQLATAIYDGEDTKAQASILKSTYGPR